MATAALVKTKKERYPNLSTVLMVEDTLQKMDESVVTIAELKRKLPREVNHYTLKIILEYLEKSNKIAVTLRGITWIHNTNSILIRQFASSLEDLKKDRFKRLA